MQFNFTNLVKPLSMTRDRSKYPNLIITRKLKNENKIK